MLRGPRRRKTLPGSPRGRFSAVFLDPSGVAVGHLTERVLDLLESARSGGEKTPEQLGRLVAHVDLHRDDVGQLGNLVLQLG